MRREEESGSWQVAAASAAPPPLSYATPATPAKKTHTLLGSISFAAPIFILVCLGGVLGKRGMMMMLASPLLPIAAVVEALARQKRLRIPLFSLAACILIMGGMVVFVATVSYH